MIWDYYKSEDSGQAWHDQYELFHTMPRSRDGVDKIDWLELEHWIRNWDRVIRRMKKVPDADTLYTFFIKQASVHKMKILHLQYYDHQKLDLAEHGKPARTENLRRWMMPRRQLLL